MALIKTIMVAIDFSKYSLPTARYAAQLAEDLGAQLLFVNVINQRDVDAARGIAASYAAFDADVFIREKLSERQGGLNDLLRRCGANSSRSRGIVRIGVPYVKLLEVIDEEKPDLLVMATKGRSDLADVVMGSCARSMYRRGRIPLLSIQGDRFFTNEK